ncbi:3-oxoacyl-reductase [Hyaloraphidium curvatum]|nr:3-oxoacyl-reductase [Hyaloraphidium curvatum]
MASRVEQVKNHLLSPEQTNGSQPPSDHAEKTRSHLLSRVGRPRLEGKVCIITGGGTPSGIGRAAGLLFAMHGAACVYLTDISTEHLERNREDILKAAPRAKVVTARVDASDEGDVEGICKRAVREHGKLDVFFAAAGVDMGNQRDSFATCTPETFIRIQTINSLSAFLAIKHAGEAMKVTSASKPDAGGSIVTVASDTGLRNTDLVPTPAYHASKAAVINLAQTGAWHLRNTGIRVNTICPGIIDTQMTKAMFDRARSRGSIGRVGQLSAMGRFGIPEEIANAAVFLASDDSSYITGIHMSVDGGVAASVPLLIRPSR